MKLKNNKKLTADISLISAFTAIICICSWISIPFVTGIPFSLQTLAIFVSVAVIGTRRSVTSVLIYVLLGIIGVPVFTGFNGGISAIMSPTGGFIIGFFFATLTTGVLLKLFPDKKIFTMTAMLSGQVVCYISGFVWYKCFYLDGDKGFAEIIAVCIAPFIIPDIIKIIVAAFLSESVRRVFKKQNIDITTKQS